MPGRHTMLSPKRSPVNSCPAPGVAALLTVPPYSSSVALRIPRHEALPRGSVFVLDVAPNYPSRRVDELLTYCRGLRRDYPSVVIASRLRWRDVRSTAQVKRLMQEQGVRLHIARRASQPVLREACSKSGVLAADVYRWLSHRLRPAGIEERGTLNVLAAAVAGKAIDSGVASRASRWASRMGLPTHRRWMAAGRVVRGLTWLQGDPDLRVAIASRKVGYASTASFSRACRQVAAAPPSEARAWIGWEWILTTLLRGDD